MKKIKRTNIAAAKYAVFMRNLAAYAVAAAEVIEDNPNDLKAARRAFKSLCERCTSATADMIERPLDEDAARYFVEQWNALAERPRDDS